MRMVSVLQAKRKQTCPILARYKNSGLTPSLSPLTKTVKLTGTHRLPGAFGNASTKEEFMVLVAQGVTAHLTAYGTDDSTNGRRQTNKKISRRGSTSTSD